MCYVLSFIVGLVCGMFLTGILASSSQVEKEEEAYRCGYKDGLNKMNEGDSYEI